MWENETVQQKGPQNKFKFTKIYNSDFYECTLLLLLKLLLFRIVILQIAYPLN